MGDSIGQRNDRIVDRGVPKIAGSVFRLVHERVRGFSFSDERLLFNTLGRWDLPVLPTVANRSVQRGSPLQVAGPSKPKWRRCPTRPDRFW